MFESMRNQVVNVLLQGAPYLGRQCAVSSKGSICGQCHCAELFRLAEQCIVPECPFHCQQRPYNRRSPPSPNLIHPSQIIKHSPSKHSQTDSPARTYDQDTMCLTIIPTGLCGHYERQRSEKIPCRSMARTGVCTEGKRTRYERATSDCSSCLRQDEIARHGGRR